MLGDVIHLRWHDRDWYTMNARAANFELCACRFWSMLPISAAAATSLTSEREQDTWTSLATTLLTPLEVIRAKQFGAIWSARWILLALLVLWAIGAGSGCDSSDRTAGRCRHPGELRLVNFRRSASSRRRSRATSTRALFFTFAAMFGIMMLFGWPTMIVVVTGILPRYDVPLDRQPPAFGIPGQ